MRKEKSIDFGHTSLKVFEPTVEQVRNFLAREDIPFDFVAFMTGGGEIPSEIYSLVTDAKPEQLKALYLSEFKQFLEEAKGMLRPFWESLELLGGAAGFLGGMKESDSKKRSAPSSGEGINGCGNTDGPTSSQL